MTRLRRRSSRSSSFVQFVHSFGVLIGIALAFLACDAGELNEYAIWPKAARTGDTIAILFNSEYDTHSAPEGALLDASVDNIVIELTDSLGHSEAITPRAVIEAPLSPTSLFVSPQLESWTGLVALFDLPDPWPNGSVRFPDTFRAVVEYDGAPTFGGNDLEVISSGGTPLSFSVFTRLSLFEQRPTLRLRPSWNSVTSEGFDPAWQIGGIEFTLRHTPGAAGDILGVEALGNGEASAGLAISSALPAQGNDRLWKISLVAPQGFSVPAKGCPLPTECYSGRWSLLDLPLQLDDSGVPAGQPIFVAGDFSIEDVVVVDLDGARLNPPFSGEQFFHLYTTDNTMVPEPGTILLLVCGGLGLAALNRLHHRQQRG